MDHATRNFSYHTISITIRKAAALAGVSYVEMFDLISKADIDIGYNVNDLRRDLE